MTERERTALQGFMNKWNEIESDKDEAFKKLQNLSRDNGLPVYCCAKTNAEQLRAAGVEIAEEWYERYVMKCGEADLIQEYGEMLSGINFWKNRY